MSILDFGRADKPFRQIQIDGLQWFEENYDKYDVFIFDVPVAGGKSLIATTIARWLQSKHVTSALITPTKILQDQYLRDFEEITVLKGQSTYSCRLGDGKTCADTKKNMGSCCTDGPGTIVCPYLAARMDAQEAEVALFNFHSYYANAMYKNTLIADEAHNAIHWLFDFYTLKLWKCEVGYDDDMELSGASISGLIAKAISSLTMDLVTLEAQDAGDSAKEALEKEIERFGYIRDTIGQFKNELLIEKERGFYHGAKKELRKTEQEYIYVKPLKVDKIGSGTLWPRSVEKLILLSATIFPDDAETLGLNTRRVGRYVAPYAIPAAHRPFIVWPVASMASRNRPASIPKIADAVKAVTDKHKDVKGIVHCTYEMAKFLQARFGSDPRFMFHDQRNKREQYEKYLAAKKPVVLIASGMAEGIDLAFDAGRFQIITQLMRPYLGDKVNKYFAMNKPRFYNLEGVRAVMQQTGRICRDPTDVGYTYMLDSEFYPFYAQTHDMWPQGFKDAILWPKK